MNTSLKHAVLSIVRALGGFAVARRLTRGKLRVLCYHGFSVRDEHTYNPAMFISARTLEARLQHLSNGRFTVLPLAEAVRRLRAGTLPPNAVTITIDDGFFGTHAVALPLFRKYDVPGTLYLTTYYVEHQHPIFNLALGYLLSQSRRTVVDLSGLGLGLARECFDLSQMSTTERAHLLEHVIVHANNALEREERLTLLGAIAERVGIDFDDLRNSRMFGLVNGAEMRELLAGGIAIELHTHRHWSPGIQQLAEREIFDNRAVIERITGHTPTHFCFPSGRFDRWQEEWMVGAGVESATTCEQGFADPRTPRYRIGRFLDGDNVGQIVFEAELAGVWELVRRARRILRGPMPPTFADDPGERRPMA